ncbi:MAG: PilW family protein [Gammaproteobacteria bacterium]|nr:PilW family protein [Gammaproteobacteria bacterium]
MVALTIGLIILAALTRLFVTSRSTYTLEEGLARVQESGRFAMEFLAQDIRMAGYAGCSANLSSSNVTNIVSPAADATSFNPNGIAGYKYIGTTGTSLTTDWSPAVPATYFPSGSIIPIAGTDVLVIQRADTLSTHLVEKEDKKDKKDDDNKTAELKIYDTAGTISKDDILMVSDCTNADIFKVTNNPNADGSGSEKVNIAHGSDSNTTNKLSTAYGNDAQIMKLVTRVYFIGRRSNSASNPPALYRKNLGNNGALTDQELVEGVDVMRLAYGEDTDNNRSVNIYRNPSSVSNWRKVLSVRAGLLVATTSNVDQAADTRTYDLAGTTVGPYNDSKRRRAFNSVIQLRNHY